MFLLEKNIKACLVLIKLDYEYKAENNEIIQLQVKTYKLDFLQSYGLRPHNSHIVHNFNYKKN